MMLYKLLRKILFPFTNLNIKSFNFILIFFESQSLLKNVDPCNMILNDNWK